MCRTRSSLGVCRSLRVNSTARRAGHPAGTGGRGSGGRPAGLPLVGKSGNCGLRGELARPHPRPRLYLGALTAFCVSAVIWQFRV